MNIIANVLNRFAYEELALLTTKVPYKSVEETDNMIVRTARIGNRDIEFYASKYTEWDKETTWKISFHEESDTEVTYKKTGSGKEFLVFSFIIQCILDIIKKHSPDFIKFVSSKSDANRADLYKRMVARYVKSGALPYTLEIKDSRHEQIFILTKRDDIVANVMHRINAAVVRKISLQQARDREYFGPVYHGTSEEYRNQISGEGFKIFIGRSRSGNISHGWDDQPDFPIHTLGYGIYFTQSKRLAKNYAGGSGKGLKVYFLDVPRLEVINFASPNTIGRWWRENGFSTTLARVDPVTATKVMTEKLKSKFDAVLQKGTAFGGGFDSNQICVYDVDRIYEIDQKLAQPFEVGSKVRRKADRMLGVILKTRAFDVQGFISLMQKRLKDPDATANQEWVARAHKLIADSQEVLKLPPEQHKYYEIRWARGGSDYNVMATEFEPAQKTTSMLTNHALARLEQPSPELKTQFDRLADKQRGAPEAMFHRDDNPGAEHSGLWQWLMEHTGDLIHRAAQTDMVEWGLGAVDEKVRKIKRTLDSAYGVNREIEEQLNNNHEFSIERNRYTGTLEQWRKAAYVAGQRYSKAYEPLKPITKAQRLGKEAAIALGKRDWSDMKRAINELDRMCKTHELEKLYFQPENI